MLADAEVQVLAAAILGFEISRTLELERGLVGWPEVRRPAEEPGDVLREHVQNLARRVPSGNALRVDLRSIDRAQVVRDYLLTRFRRRTTLTGIMPMGSEAPGSPRGDGRWAGVALTMFVRNDVLGRTGAAAAAIEAGTN
jgi:hypothetical protein